MSEAVAGGPGFESPPRMRLGLAGSMLLHVGIVSLLIFAHSGPQSMQAPMIHMVMIAAPEGPAQTGVVDAPKPDVAVPKTKKPVAPPKPTAPTPVVKKTSVPVQIPPTPAPPTAVPAKAAPAAGGGSGGHGTDVTNINLSGVAFPDQAYLNNIVNAIGSRFSIKAGTLTATVTFRIRRDGTINADSMRIIKSGGYSFDNQALSAVESAANQKAFGPLPAGFTGDGLFVTFIFDGKLGKQ